MKETLKQRCQLFVENKEIMKQNFKWENILMHLLCAEVYTEKGKKIQVEGIKACKNMIKENVGVFSNFRGNSGIGFAAILSLEENQEEKFQNILKVYKLLKEEFFSSEYLALAALTIAQISESYDYGRIAAKTKKIYSLMKAEHPFLTSSEDSNFAALLALSPYSEIELIRRVETAYQLLRKELGSFNACQSLSHIIALGEEEPETICRKVLELYKRLYEKNYKFGKSYELPVLGVLALCREDSGEMVSDVIEVFEYLRNSKGFGSFSISKRQCLMYAAMLVSSEYSDHVRDHSVQTVAFGSITSIMIAQQAAIMAAIIASTTAANSASS